MIGKSLWVLLAELIKPERHLLANICKKSKDKRHHALYKLLRKTTNAGYDFEKIIFDACADLIKSKSSQEKNKTIRRFIDFACKEIENIKIKKFINSNLSERNYLLGKIFTLNNNTSLSQYYFNKAIAGNNTIFVEEKKEQQMQSLLNNLSLSDNQRSIKALKALVIEKNEHTQKMYHASLSGIYERLSYLAMEDTFVKKEMNDLILTDDEVNQLILVSANTLEEFRYRLARLRFLFYNKDFKNDKNNLLNLLKKSKLNPEDKIYIQSQIHYLGMLADFNNCLEASKIKYDIDNHSSDPQKFYYYMLHLLSQFENNKNVSLANFKVKFSNANKDLLLFLQLLENFLNNDFKKCIKPCGQLAYSEHFHIMAWSKLIEIKLHLLKQNYDYVESLVLRYAKFLNQNESKIFTQTSNKICFKILSAYIKKTKLIPSDKTFFSSLTCLHRAIVNMK